jgi:hypothetical protein
MMYFVAPRMTGRTMDIARMLGSMLGRSIPLLSAHAATLVVIVSACLSRWFQRPAL